MYGFGRYGRLAVVAAVVIAFGLGGCGRKGALDAPPSAAISGPAEPRAAAPSDGFLTGRPVEPARAEAQPESTSSRKSFFLDWLIN